MAQYFYDLSIGQPGELPYWLDRGGDSKPSTHRWATSRDGFSVAADAAHAVARLKDPAVQGLSNVEVLIKSSLSMTAGVGSFVNSGAAVGVRAQMGSYTESRPVNGYVFTLNASASYASSERNVTVYNINNSAFGSLASHSGVLSANSSRDRYLQSTFLRLRAIGTAISYKAWRSTDDEPSDWLGSLTNSAHSSGDISLYLGGNGMSMTHSFVSVGTDGDPAPLSYPGGNRIVSGTVYMPNDMKAVGYVVRCYHQETGCLLGETLTGGGGEFSFSLPIPETELVYCVAVDQLGRTMAAPIADRLAPVAPI